MYKRTLRVLKRIGKNIDEMSVEQLIAWDRYITKRIARKRLIEVKGYIKDANRKRLIRITDGFDEVKYVISEIHYKQYIYYIIRDGCFDLIYVRRIKKPDDSIFACRLKRSIV